MILKLDNLAKILRIELNSLNAETPSMQRFNYFSS